ncbi:MAG: M1 family aminopeptidase [Acidobacteriaceae bacterium]
MHSVRADATARSAHGLPFLKFVCLLLALLAFSIPTFAQKPRLQVDSYVIDADITPATHHLIVKARVKVTALDDVTTLPFELHNALGIPKVTDQAGKPLQVERVTQDSTVRVLLPTALTANQSTTLTFDYQGTLNTAEDSPVEGLKLAHIGAGDDLTYLLYAGRWFPLVGYGTDRFSATINVTVPNGLTVVASGNAALPQPAAGGKSTYTFVQTTPSFPGTVIVGNFAKAQTTVAGNIHMFFTPAHAKVANDWAQTAQKEQEFFSSIYNGAPTDKLNVVELPADTVPATWAPDIVAISSREIGDKVNYRLLANLIAHQWWGVDVSPATRNDFWITEGMARYSEVRYVESIAGKAGFEEATKDMEVGALAHDEVPLSQVGKLDMFSPEFQSLTTDKGGMIMHMLRWYIGDDAFNKSIRAIMAQFRNKPITAQQFRQSIEQASGQKLTAFFAQWLDGTGAPEFKNKYTVYRIQKGFRVVGDITQDLDLFHMPLEIRVDTDGKSVTQRIDVEGTQSQYVIETFGRPRKIVIDPGNWVLKNSPDLRTRVAILRGQQQVAQGALTDALKEYQKALDINKNSSLASYRIAEVFFLQHNYQAAANSYRDAINGDGDPKWTEVWGHVQLGKIFDVSGQRERAVNEYRQAIQTNDNTQGALDEARKYLQKPFEPPPSQ